MVQVVKLRKIGKNLKIFVKIVFSKLIKSPRRKNFWNLLTWPERAFSCGPVFKILNCLGELGLEKNSRNGLMYWSCRMKLCGWHFPGTRTESCAISTAFMSICYPAYGIRFKIGSLVKFFGLSSGKNWPFTGFGKITCFRTLVIFIVVPIVGCCVFVGTIALIAYCVVKCTNSESSLFSTINFWQFCLYIFLKN